MGDYEDGTMWSDAADYFCGQGASPTRDGGAPLIHISSAGMRNCPVEVWESRRPMLVEHLWRGDELERQFVKMATGGATIGELLAELARTVGGSVLIARGAEIIDRAPLRPEFEALAKAWKAYLGGRENAPRSVEIPIPLGSDSVGADVRLVALATDGPLDQRAHVAMERLVGQLALSLLRRKDLALSAAHERGIFLAGLVSDGFEEDAARREATEFGFDSGGGTMLTIVITPSNKAQDVHAKCGMRCGSWFSKSLRGAI